MPRTKASRTKSVERPKELTAECPKELTAEQARGWDLVVNRQRSVFITGRAGCGKSFLVRHLVRALREQLGAEHVFVTASTGIAACNIGGTTLHSFAGIGLGKEELPDLLRRVKNRPRALKRWRAAKVLFIDEISMNDGILFQKLDAIARKVRRRPMEVWGGLRIVLIGDFFQLPPVGGRDGSRPPFAFEAPCWAKLIADDCVIDLRTQMRQRGDAEFTNMLNHLRVGIVDASAGELLRTAGSGLVALEAEGVKPTKLFAHKAKVSALNARELATLKGQPSVFYAVDKGTDQAKAMLARDCRAPTQLELKRGAQVMLLRNVEARCGLVNGVQGIVTQLSTEDNVVCVEFHTQYHGRVQAELRPETWEIKEGKRVLATRTQFPLCLAYAITIHKSQGMTIEALEVDLHGVFEYGQAYVALSRAVSLSRLRVRHYSPSVVLTSNTVIQFYGHHARAKLRREEAKVSASAARDEAKTDDAKADVSAVCDATSEAATALCKGKGGEDAAAEGADDAATSGVAKRRRRGQAVSAPGSTDRRVKARVEE